MRSVIHAGTWLVLGIVVVSGPVRQAEGGGFPRAAYGPVGYAPVVPVYAAAPVRYAAAPVAMVPVPVYAAAPVVYAPAAPVWGQRVGHHGGQAVYGYAAVPVTATAGAPVVYGLAPAVATAPARVATAPESKPAGSDASGYVFYVNGKPHKLVPAEGEAGASPAGPGAGAPSALTAAAQEDIKQNLKGVLETLSGLKTDRATIRSELLQEARSLVAGKLDKATESLSAADRQMADRLVNVVLAE
jgi:hypothetical protein